MDEIWLNALIHLRFVFKSPAIPPTISNLQQFLKLVFGFSRIFCMFLMLTNECLDPYIKISDLAFKMFPIKEVSE